MEAATRFVKAWETFWFTSTVCEMQVNEAKIRNLVIA
jgi:hypothetical protein